MTEQPIAVILMGVTGSGKTSIGEAFGRLKGWPFLDGDRFHSQENIEKMRRGEPLTDADRAPWLARLRAEIEAHLRAERPVIVGCSALREAYRAQLLPAAGPLRNRVRFVYLKISPDCARERLRQRQGHFMPPSLVESQFEALEEPAGALVIDSEAEPQAILDTLAKSL